VLAYLRLVRGDIVGAEELITRVWADDTVRHVRLVPVATENALTALALCMGDLAASGAALRRLESMIERQFRFYREAPHSWFEADGNVALLTGDTEDAAALMTSGLEWTGTEMTLIWTLHNQRLNRNDPRWRPGERRRLSFEDASTLARTIARRH
jgi:hypothetical protein